MAVQAKFIPTIDSYSIISLTNEIQEKGTNTDY